MLGEKANNRTDEEAAVTTFPFHMMRFIWGGMRADS
jgi:hypothetical protein